MKKIILLGVLVINAPLISAKELLEIRITSGVRSEQSDAVIPPRIDVISREEIEYSGASHVVDLLKGRSSIQLADTFGNGARASIGMRGFGETANANTLVLVNGRRLNNTDIASPDLNSVSLKDIERIEIIQGSATVLYGDQAVGGVINIVTRDIEDARAHVEIGAGSFGSHEIQAEVSRRLESGFSYRLSAEKSHDGGYRDNNELDYENLFGVLTYQYGSGRLLAGIQRTDEDLDTPGALYLAEAKADPTRARSEYLNDYINTQTRVFWLGLSQALNRYWKFEGEWTYRESAGDFLQSSRNAPEIIPATQDRRVNSFNPRFVGRYPFNGGRLIATLGYDYDKARYRLVSRFGPQNGDQTVDSLYGQVVVPVASSVNTTLGVRHSRVENFIRDGFTYPMGIDLNDDLSAIEVGFDYRPTRRWHLFVRAAENFRFAKADEHLNPVFGTTTILNNQTGLSLEAGTEYNSRDWSLSVVVYELDLNDEIVFDSTAFGASINLDETERQGVTMNVAYRLDESIRIEAGVSMIDADVLSGAFVGSDVPLVADYTARLGVRHRINDNWNIYGEYYLVGGRPYSGDFDNRLGELDGYRVLNMNAGYQRGNWKLDFRVNNLLNEEYSEFGARSNEFPPPNFAPIAFASVQPSPERNFQVSVRYGFE